jgi:hypothetical protein
MAGSNSPMPEPADEAALIERCRWRWWSTCLPGDQSTIADIEAIRDDINRLWQSGGMLSSRQRETLRECRCIFWQAAAWQNGLLIRHRVLVAQRMFKITEDLLLACPAEELEARWIEMSSRLPAAGRLPAWLADLVKTVRLHFSDPAQPVSDALRRQMRQVKIAIDERIVAELLTTSSLLQQCCIFVGFTLTSATGLLLCLMIENGCHALLGCRIGAASDYSFAGVLSAGILGGSLSGLSHVRQNTEGSLPAIRVSMVQPVIGGVIALVLYFGISFVNLAQIRYPAFYVSAVAVGFAERLFIRSIEEKAGRLANQLSGAAGLNWTSS